MCGNIIVCALTSYRKIDGQFYGNTVFLPCNLWLLDGTWNSQTRSIFPAIILKGGIGFTGYLTGSRSHYWLANSLNYQLFIYQHLGLRDRPTEQLVNKMTKLVTKSTFERRPDWLTDLLFDVVTVLYFLRWLNWQFVWVAPTDWLRCFDVVSDFLLGQQTNKLFCWGTL